MKRQVTAILLLVFLIGPFVVVYFSLHVERMVVREEVKSQILAGIDDGDLSAITVSLQDTNLLHWKDNYEFEYQGEMYDVVKSQKLGDSITYSCWKDNKESGLNREIRMLLARRRVNRNRQHNKRKNRLLDFHKALYTKPHRYQLVFSPALLTDNFFYRVKMYSITLPPPVPPPKVS